MKKYILSVWSMLLLICALTITAYAAEAIDLAQSGSISLSMKYEGESVAGGTVTLYQVAGMRVTPDGIPEYYFKESYRNCGISLDDITLAQTAEELEQYTISQNIAGVTKNVDENGLIVFANLMPGIYLLRQEQAAEGFYPIKAIVIALPGQENGGYCYDVVATPKLELSKPEETTPEETTALDEPTEPEKPTDPEKPTEPEETKTPELPDTGLVKWPIPILAIIGMFCVVLGWYFCASGKKSSHEN